jgi:DNA topoisomerase I
VFDDRSKGGRRHAQSVADPSVLPTLRALKRRSGRGAPLLAYRDGRRWAVVRSEEINDYLREAAGGDFTAKDFRTWNATFLAAVALGSENGAPASKAARRRRIRQAVGEVAEYLDNTPTVARGSYIDPRIFDRFDAGETIHRALRRAAATNGFADRERIERAVLALLR